MSTGITRRAWLLSAAATVSLSPIAAEPPNPRVAANHAMPIPSRTIRLEPASPRLERTVVTAIAADPRGEWVAAAGDDHAIRILQTSSLRLAKTLRGHRDLIRTLAFDPSGKKLVSAGNDGQMIVWDREADFAQLQAMQGTPAIACVRFSPDGAEMAAVGFDNDIYLIGKGSERTRPTFQCDCRDLRAVAYRDDNRLLAVGGRSGDLHLFDLATGRIALEQHLHNGRIRDIVFHHDANTAISVGEDGAVIVFDTGEQKLLHRVVVSTGKLFTAAVIDSQHVAVAGSDNVIRVVDTDAGVVTRKLSEHRGSIAALCSSGGMLFSGGFDATLRRWSLTDLQNKQRIAEGELRLDR